MLRLAKQYAEIIAHETESPESLKKWRKNADRLKAEFCLFINKNNFAFYLAALIISILLVCISLLNNISTTCSTLLQSLACSVFSGIIVAFFLERNSNKKWYETQIDKFNYDLGCAYSSIQRITGHVLLSEFVIGNYALNDYAKSKGVNPTEGNNIFILEKEVRELYKGNIDKIPYAKVIASSYTAGFIQMIEDIISKTNKLLITHHDYLTENQKSSFNQIVYRAEDFRTTLRNYEQKIFVANVKTFDDIILWAHKTATSELVVDNYMKK